MVKDSLAELLKEKLFPIIEKRLNETAHPGITFRFDRLEVSFSVSSKRFEQELIDTLDRVFIHLLDKNLAPRIGRDGQKKTAGNVSDRDNPLEITHNENRLEQFLYFLEHGYLPWYGDIQHIQNVFTPTIWQEILKQEPFISSLKMVLQRDSKCIERLVYYLDLPLLTSFLQHVDPCFNISSLGLIHQEYLLPREIRNQLFHFLIVFSLEKEGSMVMRNVKRLHYELVMASEKGAIERAKVEGLMAEIHAIILQEGIMDVDYPFASPHSSSPLEPLLTEDEPEHINQAMRVQNGGLILLHPFLPHFFKEMHFRNHHFAIQALHFMATSNTDFIEPNLIFEKYLYGVPLSTPVERTCLLSEAQKQACYNLLDDLMKHWPALKSSSREWLQEMFLQREGKLMKIRDNWKLTMEKKAQDILLRKLDWNIYVVKISSRKDLLFVEWEWS